MTIIKPHSWSQSQRPLIIASSGGGGHIIAAESLIETLKRNHTDILTYPSYQKPSFKKLSLASLIQKGSEIYHHKWGLKNFKKILPVMMPTPEELLNEMEQLFQKNNLPKNYIDFMLDLQPNGFTFTALFNLLQKTGHASSLFHFTECQNWIDKISQKNVEDKVFQILLEAASKHMPYDTIISTQPIGIPAICKAMVKYNLERQTLENIYQIELPELFMHIFITDIPHKSAKHFFQPIEKLNYLEKKNLTLHMLDLHKENCFLEKKHANTICRYTPETYPIIREAFRKNHPENILIKNNQLKIPNGSIPLSKTEKIATIMLSSSNGTTTLDYIKQLIELKIEHIIIVGPVQKTMLDTIEKLKIQNNTKTQFHLPGFVNSTILSQILKVSDLIILKGGGLSLMEMTPFKLSKKCMVFIHQPTDAHEIKGLTWEVGNTNWFLKYFKKQKKYAFIGNPNNLIEKYQEFK
jgi:effector protein SdbA